MMRRYVRMSDELLLWLCIINSDPINFVPRRTYPKTI